MCIRDSFIPDGSHNIDDDSYHEPVMIITISSVAMLVVAATVATLVTATIILVRGKSKIKAELGEANAARARLDAEIYEQIDSNQTPLSLVDTDKNIAYVHVTSPN